MAGAADAPGGALTPWAGQLGGSGADDPRIWQTVTMPGPHTVADELAHVADALRGVDEALLAARRLLVEPAPQAVAPSATGESLAGTLSALADRLSETSEECGDGARALQRQVGDG